MKFWKSIYLSFKLEIENLIQIKFITLASKIDFKSMLNFVVWVCRYDYDYDWKCQRHHLTSSGMYAYLLLLFWHILKNFRTSKDKVVYNTRRVTVYRWSYHSGSSSYRHPHDSWPVVERREVHTSQDRTEIGFRHFYWRRVCERDKNYYRRWQVNYFYRFFLF